MIKFLAGLATLAGGWTLSAWLLMLAVGVLHAEWLPAVPPVSYLVALALTVLLGARMVIHVGVATFVKELAEDKQ